MPDCFTSLFSSIPESMRLTPDRMCSRVLLGAVLLLALAGFLAP